jgi:hypothetical protein
MAHTLATSTDKSSGCRSPASNGYTLGQIRRRRRSSALLGRVFIDRPTGLRHFPPDLSLVASLPCLGAIFPVDDTLQPIAFSLLADTFALVRKPLSLIRRLLAILGDAVTVIGHPVAFVRDPLTPGLFGFAPLEAVLALVQLGGAPIGVIPDIGFLVTGHRVTLSPPRSR